LLITERDENVLQLKLYEVRILVSKSNLMINIGKTVAMSYHTKQSRFLMRPKVTYTNTDIAYKPVTKFLVIHITENLKWTTHICISRPQLSKVCYVIKSFEGIMRFGMIRNFYHSKFELQ